MSTKSKTTATESDELTVEQRLDRLENAAQKHGWDILPPDSGPLDPPTEPPQP